VRSSFKKRERPKAHSRELIKRYREDERLFTPKWVEGKAGHSSRNNRRLGEIEASRGRRSLKRLTASETIQSTERYKGHTVA